MNKVMLTGRLTKDPEFTTTVNGISVCRFSLAVDRKFTNENGEKEADFINIVVWRGLAENCNKYLRKGNKVGIVGSIQTRTYDAQDGSKRYATEVIAEDVEFLSQKTENDGKPKTESQEKQETMQKFEPISESNLPFWAKNNLVGGV